MPNKRVELPCRCKMSKECGNKLILEGTAVSVEGSFGAKTHSTILSKTDATKLAKALYKTFRGAKP